MSGRQSKWQRKVIKEVGPEAYKAMSQKDRMNAILLARFGTPEKVREFRAQLGRKGGAKKVPKGLALIDPERQREISIKGGIARHR